MLVTKITVPTVVRKRIKSHKTFQITITSGLMGAVLIDQNASLVAMLSLLVNMLWIWEDDIRGFFGQD
jgi:hypothetical protein